MTGEAMTRVQTLLSYAVIAGALGLCELLARRRGGVTFTEFVSALTRWRRTRWVVLAAWLWLGWHLFVRVDSGG